MLEKEKQLQDPTEETAEQPVSEAETPEEVSSETTPAAPEKKSRNSGFIPSEKFDQLDGLKEDFSEMDPELEGVEHLEISYTLSGEDVYAGLKVFQRHVMLLKNSIYTVILILLLGVFAFRIINGDTQFMNFVCLGLALATIVIVWHTPYRHRKQMAASVESELKDHVFSMKVYPDRLLILQENGVCTIQFAKEKVYVYENQALYVIRVGKERLYILPKRCMEEELQKQLTALLSESLHERYHVIGTESISS